MFLVISGVKGKRKLRKRRSRHTRIYWQGETATEEPWSDQQSSGEPGETTTEEPWSDQQYCPDNSLPTSVEPGEMTIEEPRETTTDEPWSEQNTEETFTEEPWPDQNAEETFTAEPWSDQQYCPDIKFDVKASVDHETVRKTRRNTYNQQAEETTMSDQQAEATMSAEPWSDQQYCPDIKFDVKASEGHAIVRKTMSNTYVYKTKYTCNLCGRKFPFKCKLEEHQRIHTGQKPFVCTICSNTFTQKSSLTRHYVKIHQVPPVADFKYLK